MKSKRRLVIIVLVVLGAAAWWIVRARREEAPVSYRSVTVQRGDLQQNILATGVVQPQNRVEVKPPISGRVEDVLVQEGELVKKGDILAWMSSTDRAALLDAARARGEAELARWQELYKAAPLLAPLDGAIIARKAEPGQTVSAQDTVLVLSDRLIIKAQVDETDIGHVRVDQRAEVVLDAYPDTAISSRVDHIAYEAETVNNVTVYRVDVLPDKVPDFMRSGMTADVTFHVDARMNVLILPAEAVQRADGTAQVMISDERPQDPPRRVEVQTGLDNGKSVEITDGLSEGQTVLIPAFQMPKAPTTGSSPFMPGGMRRR